MTGRDPHAELKFRDPERARALSVALGRNVDAIGRKVAVMHVCGSHEQAIARFGLRAILPESLELIMGPGAPFASPMRPRWTRPWRSPGSAPGCAPTAT